MAVLHLPGEVSQHGLGALLPVAAGTSTALLQRFIKVLEPVELAPWDNHGPKNWAGDNQIIMK